MSEQDTGTGTGASQARVIDVAGIPVTVPADFDKQSREAQLAFLRNALSGTKTSTSTEFDPHTVELITGSGHGVSISLGETANGNPKTGGRRDIYPSSMMRSLEPALLARMIRYAQENKDSVAFVYDKSLNAKDAYGKADASARAVAEGKFINANNPQWAEFDKWAANVLPALDVCAAIIDGNYESAATSLENIMADAEGEEGDEQPTV